MNAYENTTQQALLYAIPSFLSPPPPVKRYTVA